MTYSVVQTVQTNFSGMSYTIGINGTTAGNMLVLVISLSQNASVVFVRDSQMGTWNWNKVSSTDGRLLMFYRPNITGGNVTVTVSIGDRQTAMGTSVLQEYSGAVASSPYDTRSESTDSSAVTDHDISATPLPANKRNLAIIAYGGTWSTSPTWTVTGGGFGNLVQRSTTIISMYKVTIAVANKEINEKIGQSGELTSSQTVSGNGIIAIFKNATQPVPQDFMGFM